MWYVWPSPDLFTWTAAGIVYSGSCCPFCRKRRSLIWWPHLAITWGYGGSAIQRSASSVCLTMWVSSPHDSTSLTLVDSMSDGCRLASPTVWVAVSHSCSASFFWQNKNSDFCAPLTSFDWNEVDPNLLGTSSIDTTCTIWGLEVCAYQPTYCKTGFHSDINVRVFFKMIKK